MKKNLFGSIMIVFVLFAQTFSPALAADAWQNVGSVGFSAGAVLYTSLAIDSGGTPYVAYTDSANVGKASVMKFNGTDWEQVGSAGFSGWAELYYISLAIDSSGTPYVAYTDGRANVMKFNGTDWEQVGNAGFLARYVDYTSLAIDSSGTPYVAYSDRENGGKASVMKFNGTDWEQVGNAGFSAGEANDTFLVIDSGGTPYVAYKDIMDVTPNSWKASVMKFNGTDWEQVGGAGFSAGEANDISLAIYNGTPYVAYTDYSNSKKATVMKFNGTAWEPVGTVGFSAKSADFTSLVIYSGTPYVAYRDWDNSWKVSVMKFNGTAWEPVGGAGFSAGEAWYTSLAIDSGGTPYVAYSDRENGGKASVMKYDTVYSATYDGNGNTGGTVPTDNNSPYAAGSTVTVLGNTGALVKTGYTFTGWNTAADGSGTGYAPSATFPIAADTTLYAQWNDLRDFVITVKTDNLGTSTNTQFTIPTTGIGYNYNVDCNNDGTNELNGATGNYTCNYGAAGTYTIRIKDNSGALTGFPRIYFNNGGDSQKLLTIVQWGKGKWTSMAGAFFGCANMTMTATDAPDLSGVTNMNNMFRDASAFNGNIGNWNTGNVTNMGSMFSGAKDFNQDISVWDTANVTDMSNMFQASDFNQDIGDWDTANVTNMSSMFHVNHAFNQDISGWNTSKVTNMNAMFRYARDFEQNLGGWDVTAVTDATSMFYGMTLSTANYDALLQGWNAQTLKPNVAFDGGNSKYCAGEAARTNMTASDGWIITDGGIGCYPVTYNANGATGGTVPADQTKTYGVDLPLAANTGSLVKTDYTFNGWNTAANGTGTHYNAGAAYSANAAVTLYAEWTLNTYTVSYNANGATSGSAPSDQTKSHGIGLTLATNSGSLVKTGSTFTGWNTAANGTGTHYNAGATYSANAAVTLYAEWMLNTYTVSYNANGATGGSSPSDQTKSHGIDLNLATNSGSLVKTDYTFNGWNTAANGTGTHYNAGATYSANVAVTLYAEWSKIIPTFGDVPMSHPYWSDIEILYANGLTAGCSTTSLEFCPDMTLNRAQSAVFLVRSHYGNAFTPPSAPWPTFGDDFSAGPWAQPWAQAMYNAGLTAGCSTDSMLFCPWQEMTRAQAAVFGMRLKYGTAYLPPVGTGTVFADITDPTLWYAGWAEQAYSEGMLPACGTQGGKPLFCPNDIVARGLGAHLIVRAKNLTMP